MNAQELSSYIALKTRLARAEELLISLQAVTTPGASALDTMPNASVVKDKIGNLFDEIMDLTKRIAYLKREIKREKKKLEDFIDNVSDERYRVAFRLKYLQNLTWGQVTEVFGEKFNEEGLKKACYRYLEETNTQCDKR